MRTKPIATALSFDDIQLLDDYSETKSRSDIDISVVVNPKAPEDKQVRLGLPVISAAMSMLDSHELAKELLISRGSYCVHRYLSVDERINFQTTVTRNNRDRLKFCSVAIGAKDSLEDLEKMYQNGLKWFVYDVAACNNLMTIEYILNVIKPMKEKYDDMIFYVGNFSSVGFLYALLMNRLLKYVDGVKVSQGGSKVCSTRINTGVGVPTFQSVLDCSDWFEEEAPLEKIVIVADGGIKNSGDMAKAFAAGASLVMVGSALAGYFYQTSEDNKEEIDGHWHYHVFGMASEKAKRKAGMPVRNIEGISTLKPMKEGHAGDYLQEVRQNIQSSLSLQGFSSLEESVGHKRFIKVSYGGINEAKTY